VRELMEGLVIGVAERVFEEGTDVPDPTLFVAVTAKV
jgi:hypothetical protein